MMDIELNNASKRYKMRRREVVALDNVSLSIAGGSFTILTGPSGSGKSTLLQIIGGVTVATEGKVVVGGYDLAGRSAAELAAYRRQNVGIIFQQFYLDPVLTVRRNIELAAMFADVPEKERVARTKELARIIGISEQLDHLPSEISGGQVQRTAIARAIYNRPKVLIADEPTSNLDPENAAIVLQLLRQIQQAYGTTIVIATHDGSLAAEASQVIKLSEGRVVG